MSKNKDFKQLWIELERFLAEMKHRGRLVGKQKELGRRSAFRAAVRFVTMLRERPRELQDRIEVMGFKGHDYVDQFVDKMFAPCQLFDEDPREIIHAVEEGVTEKAFMQSGALGSARAHKHKRIQEEMGSVLLPSEPPQQLPVEEQLKHWHAIAVAAKDKVKGLEEICRNQRKQIDKLNRTITRIEHELDLWRNKQKVA